MAIATLTLDISTIAGSGDAEFLAGTASSDILVSNGGADTIDGGDSLDSLVLLADRAEYSVTGSADSFTITPIHGGGEKLVQNVEAVVFTDGMIATADLLAGAAPLAPQAAAAPAAAAIGALAAPSTPAAGRTILHMGENQAYRSLQEALDAAHDGDVIQVDAGTYTDQSAVANKSVTIEGVGGLAHFQNTQNIANGKAVLVDQAQNLTIRNLEISGAQVSEGNGAGIRHEAGTLTVQNSFFHDNQNGIMGGTVSGGRIVIDRSEFLHNGAGDSQTHSVYAGSIAFVSVTNSSFSDANNGIALKSRAASNEIHDNFFIDSAGGQTTYQIDLPNGHDADISGNVFYKSADAGNRATIHFGGELAGATGILWVTSNQFYSDRDPTSAVLNHTGSTVLVADNALDPTVSIPVDSGPATVQGNIELTGSVPLPVLFY